MISCIITELQGDERRNALAFDLIRPAYNRGPHYFRMGHHAIPLPSCSADDRKH